jgi:S-disulfanyl-L-cysteine oxidoreductase SoxD
MAIAHRHLAIAIGLWSASLLGERPAIAVGLWSASLSSPALLPGMQAGERPAIAQLFRGAVHIAQSPTFGLGRTPKAEDLKAIDIEVTPDGKGLVPGRGTAETGKTTYANRCATCHGPTGVEGPQDVLVGGRGSLKAPARPLKTIGSYWPYATTIWDYIRRAMPFDHPGTLTPDQIYETTAYLLFLNGIVGEHDVLDQTTLPQVKMPNRDGFVSDPRPDIGPDTITPNPRKPQSPPKRGS